MGAYKCLGAPAWVLSAATHTHGMLLQVAENKLNNAAMLQRLEAVTQYPPMILNYAK